MLDYVDTALVRNDVLCEDSNYYGKRRVLYLIFCTVFGSEVIKIDALF